jgi:2-polyprenyl-6-hydroxyphenyl methylase / 3-demethylubiquinone-9 3-methyltransferase
VKYLYGNAQDQPFEDESFDVVLAMDLLEHIESPEKVIRECSRVLKPHGLLFFHTFNRNFFSYLFIIKGLEWFVKNTPKNMHVYNLFIKPKDMLEMLTECDLSPDSWIGLRPKFSKAFFKMLMTRKIPKNFSFTLCKSLLTGYMGVAVKLSR